MRHNALVLLVLTDPDALVLLVLQLAALQEVRGVAQVLLVPLAWQEISVGRPPKGPS